MTSGGGRCRDGTEAAQQCLEAAATLLRLGIGLHCCNTRNRPKMGSAPRCSLQLRASPTLVDGGEEEEEEVVDGEADYLPLERTACSIASASCRSSPKLGVRYHGRREVPRLVPKYPSAWAHMRRGHCWQ